jgi:hypothetical protein
MANEAPGPEFIQAYPDPIAEAERRLEEAAKIGAPEVDLSNLGLGPSFEFGRTIDSRVLGRLRLWILNLAFNNIATIPLEGWQALGKLERLRLLRL